MKNKYLYQGWAGNTYSHKCNALNSTNSSCLYFKLKKDIASGTDAERVIGILAVLASETLIKTSDTCTSNILGLVSSGNTITKDVLRAIRIYLPCFVLAKNMTIPPTNSLQEVFKDTGINIDELLEEITEAEYNSIKDNMIKELEEELTK